MTNTCTSTGSVIPLSTANNSTTSNSSNIIERHNRAPIWFSINGCGVVYDNARGRGIIATRNWRRGELVIQEQPLIGDIEYMTDTIINDDSYWWLAPTIKYKAMTVSLDDDDLRRCARDIILTNRFEHDGARSRLYHHISLFNHRMYLLVHHTIDYHYQIVCVVINERIDCDANCAYDEVRGKRALGAVVTLRDIKQGRGEMNHRQCHNP
jgi:hypothetical protein